MMWRMGVMAGRWFRAAFRLPLDHRFLLAAVVLTGGAVAVLDVVYDLARMVFAAAFCIAVAVTIAYFLTRIPKPEVLGGKDRKGDRTSCR